MTPELTKITASAVEARLAKESLAAFVRASWHVLEPATPYAEGWHVKVICDHVQAQLLRTIRRRGPAPQNLLITIPPRCLKTRIVNVCAVAWAWLHAPWLKIGTFSSNPRVAQNAADDTRKLIGSTWYQTTFAPTWKIRDDMTALSALGNTKGGVRAARGITSDVTGEGFDWLCFDDPHDAEDVHSQNLRESVINKWDRAIASRINDPKWSCRTGIMQRLRVDDLGGHVEKSGDWDTLKIPALLTREILPTFLNWVDPRTVGDNVPLHERLTLEFLAKEKRRLGSRDFAAQYNQEPAAADGAIFKGAWLKYYDELPKLEGISVSVDATFKKTENGSRVSIIVLGSKGAQRFVVDNVTRAMTFSETLDAIRAVCAKWNPTKVLVEDKANGPAIIDTLKATISGIVAVEPHGSKEARAQAIAPTIEAGDVYWPRNAPWLDDMRFELESFPNGAHDDQVDALTQALWDLRAGFTIWDSLG